MRLLLATLLLPLAALASPLPPADSDAPDRSYARGAPPQPVASHAHALATWRTPEDINAWIGAHFDYDMERALRLSETQRGQGQPLPIHAPAAFFAAPSGICVDLARFAVETLQAIAPATRPRYLMIEFDPVAIRGNTLRRHWLAVFERDGALWFFGDSRRPGHLAGPYPDTASFIADYASYRERPIVAFAERDSYARRMRTQAVRQVRSPATAPGSEQGR